MKINLSKFENENGEKRIMITFEHHRTVIFTREIGEEKENQLNEKLKIIDEYLNTTNPIYTKKEILKTWAKIEEQMKPVYKELDNRGGVRKGSGRKMGSKKTTPKSDRTERFTMAITAEEKKFLTDQLEQYRRQHSLID